MFVHCLSIQESVGQDLHDFITTPRQPTVEFIYGGCGGNLNNFETIFECRKKCISMCEKESVCFCILTHCQIIIVQNLSFRWSHYTVKMLKL